MTRNLRFPWVGAILIISNDEATMMSKVLGFRGITAATTNHRQRLPESRDRMLKMFKRARRKVMGSLVGSR